MRRAGTWSSCAEMLVCVSVLQMQKVGMLTGGDTLGFTPCPKRARGALDQCHGCFFSLSLEAPVTVEWDYVKAFLHGCPQIRLSADRFYCRAATGTVPDAVELNRFRVSQVV